MKINFLLLTILTAAISGCSTSYKTGQTPDDVYYSPARYQTDEVRKDREANDRVDNTVYTSTEDREIRRRVQNRRYRRYDDRYNYPYGSYGPAYGNPKLGSTQNTSEPRKTNLGAYSPNSAPDSAKSYNPKLGTQNNTGASSTPTRTFGTPSNTTSNNKGIGNFIRKVLSGDNNSNNNSSNSNNNSTSRTFDNSTKNNNSNNSSSNTNSSPKTETKTTSAPVRTFGKQN